MGDLSKKFEHAVEIAPKIWWVGYVIPNDPFQCHAYLIEDENESILIDPGSKLTWEVTRKKIKEVTSLENIKYIICHHQDPDITSCIGDLLDEIGAKNRYIVTHWRTKTLLKHYGWGIEFYEVDKNNWKLNTKNREIEFIFTPYMHFPGNICSYDKKSKILFSSDIFGAFTETFNLFAKDAKEYFEGMKPFHTHYMPNKEIVRYGLKGIEKKDIEMIAPQHGSIIPKRMIPYLISNLKNLDVGIYLNFKKISNIKRISKANEILAKIFEQTAFTATTSYEKIGNILMLINELFALERTICISSIDSNIVMFDSSLNYSKELFWREDELFKIIEKLLSKDIKPYIGNQIEDLDLYKEYLIYPFITYNEYQSANGVCYFLFSRNEDIKDEDKEILASLKKIFSIILKKEIEIYKVKKERVELLRKVITDSLTKLYNRHYLEEIGTKEFEKAKRHRYPFSVAILDIDDFKKINDTYGHDIGDIILKHFAKTLTNCVRESDFVFRYGGEEFLIILPFTSSRYAKKVLNRIKKSIVDKSVAIGNNQEINYTFSAGVAELDSEVSILELIKKADKLLYKAKRNGKNEIEI